MPRRLGLATLIAFVLHGVLVLAGVYRLSYDAYNHMFFADHYLRDWWSLWEPRWYTGFEVSSYPPLVHQLNALLGGMLVRLLPGRLAGAPAGLAAAFALLLWATLTAYPLAVYAFSRVFSGERAAGYAALGAAFLPSIYLSGHAFGQLPTLVGSLLALLGAAVLADFLRHGSVLRGALAVALFATAMSAHHATLLFQPWLLGAVLLAQLFRRDASRRQVMVRFAGFGLLAVGASLLVIWPFWEWGRGQSLQTPIDHISRHNFLTDPNALGVFFVPVYGLFIPFLPAAARLALRRRLRGPGLALLVLFLLGLGGTTPLPRLLFGAGWDWLTYDRFAFWASLTLLPFFGALAAGWMRRSPARRLAPWYAGLMAGVALLVGYIPAWLPTQPTALDLTPVVAYLGRGERAQYRYITLGFGDQLARLSLLTLAATIDGSYHTARGLPELRASAIGQIDTAFWFPGGMHALGPILQKSGTRGVRWAFVNLKFYEPVLEENGWVRRRVLANRVSVWENPSAVLPPPVTPPSAAPIASFSWGAFPLLALFVTTCLGLRAYGATAGQRVLEAAGAFATGLLPLGLTLWYYRTLFEIEQPRIYFTYSSALFFLSDGLALAAVLTWLIARLPRPAEGKRLRLPALDRKMILRPEFWLFAVCLLATLSVFWSLDGRTSLYISLHLWLCFGVFLALRSTPRALVWFAAGACAALLVQATVGALEFITQSTALAAPLGLDWPGKLLPAMRGASVVQLADGARWLRAYGTLPHPNLLAGFALALLAAPLALYLRRSGSPPIFAKSPHSGIASAWRKWGDGRGARHALLSTTFQVVFPLLFALTLALIVLTFSRSAWLALLALGAGLLAYRKHYHRANLLRLGLGAALPLALLAVPLSALFSVRLGEGHVQTEQVSNYTRWWLVQRTLELIGQHTFTGAGVGSFSLDLSRHVAPFYQIEPVHNLPLLVFSELGAGGLLILGGLAVSVALTARRMRTPAGRLLTLALLGLAVISMFDHYFWTLAPGRLLAACLLGLWAGQVNFDEPGG
jgi:hypothetical protein